MFHDEIFLNDSSGGVTREFLDHGMVAPRLLLFLFQREPVPCVLQSVLSGLPVEICFPYQPNLFPFGGYPRQGQALFNLCHTFKPSPFTSQNPNSRLGRRKKNTLDLIATRPCRGKFLPCG